ncbi:hypothetical protein [Erythrobacter sp. F6033]|uniref:hypothetical protein n=1 Tax=Erythrobacter sp. F6033 TaxID=2926401 RepID=UPI001FF63178|nr:hypothetical protein [Erythrobacter sp. F6033]MCK0129111.1 hypothetical protein [Erythrobacter sp. F6033]
MKWKPIYFALYATFLSVWIFYARPWENGLEPLLSSAPFVLAGMLFLALADYIGSNYGIAEARFDSETGKLIEEEQDK